MIKVSASISMINDMEMAHPLWCAVFERKWSLLGLANALMILWNIMYSVLFQRVAQHIQRDYIVDEEADILLLCLAACDAFLSNLCKCHQKACKSQESSALEGSVVRPQRARTVVCAVFSESSISFLQTNSWFFSLTVMWSVFQTLGDPFKGWAVCVLHIGRLCGGLRLRHGSDDSSKLSACPWV